MAYTVKQLAKISGVSSRTLHFYDEQGLLKPAFIGENKYRYYEGEQLLLLQQILFYRELGFPLNDIKTILCAKDFDKLKALESHKMFLEKSLDRTEKLIKTVNRTIAHIRGKLKMRDAEMFEGFDPIKQMEYEKLLVNKGIISETELDKTWEKAKDWKKTDWENYKKEGDVIYKELVAVMLNKSPPSSKETQALIRRHYELIKQFYDFDQNSFLGLGKMYLEHPDFRKFFEVYHPQLLEYVVEAMKVFAEKKLS